MAFGDGGFYRVERGTFGARLLEAGRYAVSLAREHVLQPLPDEVAFRVYPNQSFDGHPLAADEVVFPDETLPENAFLDPWSADAVLGHLWRAGKVPEWIDAAVEAEDGQRSPVGLRCCGRFSESEDMLYHKLGGLAPFSIKSPVLPIGWVSVEASGRFDLYWLQQRKSSRQWWWFW